MKTRGHGLALVPLVLGLPLLLASTPALPDAETLLREGNAAFERGDFTAAVALYEQAEVRATDPGLVAFNLAAARYRLAQEASGPSSDLEEAEQLYRCCLEPGDPRRPRALYALGNCLLRKASRGQPDPADIQAALDCYEQCLRDTGNDTRLAADARHNRERARLLALQIVPPANRPPDKQPPNDSANPPRPQPPDRQQPPTSIGETETGDRPQQKGMAMPVQPEPGQTPIHTNEPPPPGKGNLPPVPDRADVTPLSPDQAARLLEQAARRIVEEHQQHRRGTARPLPADVRDW
jgi:tetratricopeptide (TPR) repeat protein